MGEHSLLDDIVFKMVFGQHAEILRPLLNAILGLEGPDRIRSVEVLNPAMDKGYALQRGAILDVAAVDDRARRYNVEVQVRPQSHYVKRSLYYAARWYAQQGVKGENFGRLVRTVGISLLDFVIFPDVDKLHSIYRFKELDDNRELCDDLELHYVELPKFKFSSPQTLRTPFEKWMYVLKFGDIFERGIEVLPDNLEQEEGIKMALDEMNNAYSDVEARILIESRFKAQMDAASELAEALEGGARKIARKLIDAGIDTSTVASCTGLSAEQVQQLRSQAGANEAAL